MSVSQSGPRQAGSPARHWAFRDLFPVKRLHHDQVLHSLHIEPQDFKIIIKTGKVTVLTYLSLDFVVPTVRCTSETSSRSNSGSSRAIAPWFPAAPCQSLFTALKTISTKSTYHYGYCTSCPTSLPRQCGSPARQSRVRCLVRVTKLHLFQFPQSLHIVPLVQLSEKSLVVIVPQQSALSVLVWHVRIFFVMHPSLETSSLQPKL